MRLLPWNNPLVVTSFMLRARRGGFFTGTTIYLGLLAMAYFGWMYYFSIYGNQFRVQLNPHKAFFLFLFAAQCIFSGIIVLGQASSAIKNEVMNKTLDFQRIAAVSPWDILMGKLLGQPTAAYLLAIAALPVAVFCLLNGVPGVGPIELVLMWVQMLTFLFLLGTCAIQNTLQIATPKATGSSTGFGIFIGIVAMTTITTYTQSGAQSFLSDPRRVSVAALVTPLTAYAGAYVENPWAAKFYWFGVEIPCLLFTPIAHVAIGWLALNVMSRRLQKVENTPLGKRLGYLFLAVADVVAVGVIASTGRGVAPLWAAGMPIEYQLGFFLIVHLLLTTIFLIAVTPRRDLLWAWVWRYRGRRTPLADAVREDHSPNTAPLLISLAFGAISVVILLLVGGPINTVFLAETTVTVATSILFWGILYQAFLLVAAKYGGSVFVMTAFLLIGVPIMVGGILSSPDLRIYRPLGQLILHITPATQLVKWAQGGAPIRDNLGFEVSPYPLAVGYVVLGLLAYVLIRRRLESMIVKVDRTKEAMGVPPREVWKKPETDMRIDADPAVEVRP